MVAKWRSGEVVSLSRKINTTSSRVSLNTLSKASYARETARLTCVSSVPRNTQIELATGGRGGTISLEWKIKPTKSATEGTVLY